MKGARLEVYWDTVTFKPVHVVAHRGTRRKEVVRWGLRSFTLAGGCAGVRKNLPGRRSLRLAKDLEGVVLPAESVDAVDRHRQFMLKERELQLNVGGGMLSY